MKNRPNIVIILTDQQRAGLSRREGYPLDTTPFLDALAARGTWFSRAYTSMPVCGPARVSLLTGRYPGASRVRTNWNIEDAFYGADLFDVFREAGYATALIGKNHSHLTRERTDAWYECGHLGFDEERRSPEEAAFDDWLHATHFHMALEATPFPLERQIPHRLVDRSQDWVASVSERPFLLWLSFPEPHNPYQVPEPYYSMFPPETLPLPAAGEEALAGKGFKYRWCREAMERAFPGFAGMVPRARSNYLGMLRLLDDEIARFAGFLDTRGLRENTIIAFLSDHGDFVGEYGLMRKGAGLPDVLTRIPLMISGPGIAASAEAHPAHVSICDVMPTLCEAAGIPLPDGVQGRSLWPLLTGQAYPSEEFDSAYAEHGFGGLDYTGGEPLDPHDDGLTDASEGEWGAFDCLNSRTQSGTMRMVRRGDWKLTLSGSGAGELYDLRSDPAEVMNRYDDPSCADKRAALLEELALWMLRVQDPLPLPRRRYVLKRGPHNYVEGERDQASGNRRQGPGNREQASGGRPG